jgi:hypothetical protein
VWFDWSDEKIIWEAIASVGLCRITARLRPMVVIGFEGDGWLMVHDLMEIVRNGHETCIVVDPRPDLDRTLSRIEADFGDGPWINVLGIARLRVADRQAYRALLGVLEGRWDWSWPEMPSISTESLCVRGWPKLVPTRSLTTPSSIDSDGTGLTLPERAAPHMADGHRAKARSPRIPAQKLPFWRRPWYER